jgi:hypothetical protein
MTKQITFERIDRIIGVLLQSPNNSAQRAKLWFKLHNLRSTLKDLNS